MFISFSAGSRLASSSQSSCLYTLCAFYSSPLLLASSVLLSPFLCLGLLSNNPVRACQLLSCQSGDLSVAAAVGPPPLLSPRICCICCFFPRATSSSLQPPKSKVNFLPLSPKQVRQDQRKSFIEPRVTTSREAAWEYPPSNSLSELGAACI